MIRVVLVLAVLVAPVSAAAELPDTCTRLRGRKLEEAEALLRTLHPYDCCDGTFAQCLSGPKPPRLVVRLARFICKMVADGYTEQRIRLQYQRRAASMRGFGSASMDTSSVVWAGDRGAPVQVVVYACARCPFCSVSVPAIYRAVTRGALRGKARLAFRIFPVKSHRHSAIAGIAFEAARRLGKFWPYVLLAYREFDSFEPSRLTVWATKVGLDAGAFARLLRDRSVRKAVILSKKEGLRNGVDATPTYFINGRMYRSLLKPWALICAIDEEYERLKGMACRP